MIFFIFSDSSGAGSKENQGENPENPETESDESDEVNEDSLLQSGKGMTLPLKRKFNTDVFIAKVAKLVTKKLSTTAPTLHNARPVNTGWTNFDLSPPSTSVIGSVNTTPPIHFDQKRQKNDDNDSFGNNIICTNF